MIVHTHTRTHSHYLTHAHAKGTRTYKSTRAHTNPAPFDCIAWLPPFLQFLYSIPLVTVEKVLAWLMPTIPEVSEGGEFRRELGGG
jgi:hypothetical protein